ncbi:hypothetical protein LCGC14_1576610 [marine sediment metagenome]|uniref:Uncharacterized protein n=1 Tax=marine sediment metagenome TaxID=412755 RepID=A0A0F9II85_9ZZZZ
MKEETVMLVIGDLVKGFEFIGPFKDFNQAETYALGITQYNRIVTLRPPDES